MSRDDAEPLFHFYRKFSEAVADLPNAGNDEKQRFRDTIFETTSDLSYVAALSKTALGEMPDHAEKSLKEQADKRANSPKAVSVQVAADAAVAKRNAAKATGVQTEPKGSSEPTPWSRFGNWWSNLGTKKSEEVVDANTDDSETRDDVNSVDETTRDSVDETTRDARAATYPPDKSHGWRQGGLRQGGLFRSFDGSHSDQLNEELKLL